MRSSDTAKSARVAISAYRAEYFGRTNISDSIASHTAHSSTVMRELLANRSVAPIIGCMAPSLASPREEAMGPYREEGDHDAVDHEGSHLRHVVLSRDVGHSEQERREQRPRDRRRSAHRDHDQEIDHELQGKRGIEADDVRAQRPAEAREPAAEREGQEKDAIHVDAEPRCDARIVDGGAEPAAESRFHQHPLQYERKQSAHDDDEQAIDADSHPTEIEALLQERGQLDEDLLRAEEIVDRRDRHEHEADREEHLVERRASVKAPVERRLEDRPDERG